MGHSKGALSSTRDNQRHAKRAKMFANTRQSYTPTLKTLSVALLRLICGTEMNDQYQLRPKSHHFSFRSILTRPVTVYGSKPKLWGTIHFVQCCPKCVKMLGSEGQITLIIPSERRVLRNCYMRMCPLLTSRNIPDIKTLVASIITRPSLQNSKEIYPICFKVSSQVTRQVMHLKVPLVRGLHLKMSHIVVPRWQCLKDQIGHVQCHQLITIALNLHLVTAVRFSNPGIS